MKLRSIIISVLFCISLFAFADERYAFDNEIDTKRFQTLSYQIKCLVCQGQSIGDSDSYFATNLRDWLHEAITEGYSDIEIRQQLLERFGEKIFYSPGLKANTYLLWTLPALFLILGLFAFLRRGR